MRQKMTAENASLNRSPIFLQKPDRVFLERRESRERTAATAEGNNREPTAFVCIIAAVCDVSRAW